MTTLYVDASALVKLAIHETESSALEVELQGASLVSSAIVHVELVAAIRRVDPRLVVRTASEVLRVVSLVPADIGVLWTAPEIGPPGLRALDAIHLATAVSVMTDLNGFVVYDRRLAEAAGELGFHVLAPGTPPPAQG